MDRRSVLKGAGAALIGSAAATGAVSAEKNNGEGYLPNRKVPYTYVYPFVDFPQEKLAGRWIIHRIGWIAVPVEELQRDGETYVSTYDEVERYKESVTVRAWIDGEEIAEADQYWREPVKINDTDWVVYWDYATPPKAPGEYTFELTIEYEETYEINEEELAITREEGTKVTHSATYSIVPERVHEPS